MLGGEGDVSRRPGALAVAGLHRTPVGGVRREAGHCVQLHLGSGLGEGGRGGSGLGEGGSGLGEGGRGGSGLGEGGSGLWEGGRGGRAGEGVVCDDTIPFSHGWRLPGEIDFSLSSICCKHQQMSSRGYCNKIIIQITKTNTYY